LKKYSVERSNPSELPKEGRCPLELADESLRNDRDFMSQAVQIDWHALKYLGNSLKKDKDLILGAIGDGETPSPKGWWRSMQLVINGLKNDRLPSETILKAIEKDYRVFRLVYSDLKDLKSFVLEAFERNGMALQDARSLFKEDEECVSMAAVQSGGRALQYAQKDLVTNRRFMLDLLGKNGLILQHASENFKAYRSAVLVAVRQNGLALKHAEDNLRRDIEIALAATEQNVEALQYVRDELKENSHFALHFAFEVLQQLEGKIKQARQSQDRERLNQLLGQQKYLFSTLPLVKEDFLHRLAPENKEEFALLIINYLTSKDRLNYGELSLIFDCRYLAGNQQEGVTEDYSEKLKETFENYSSNLDSSDECKKEIKKFLDYSELFLLQKKEAQSPLFMPLPGLPHPGFHDAPLSGQEQPASSSNPDSKPRDNVAEAVARMERRGIKNRNLQSGGGSR
ncbi:MAG: DUF4116 domain-containing protein, partial [Chlamydiae bacterium]|nr:DUF4116 domain-containing protein [Chlamydiota bacterium]